MAFTPKWQASGEIDNDPEAYGWKGTVPTSQSAATRTGSYGLRFDYSTNGIQTASYYGQTVGNNARIHALQIACRLDGAAPAAGKVLPLSYVYGGSPGYLIAIDENRKVNVYKSDGTKLATGTTSINIAGSLQVITIIFDAGVRVSDDVFVYVWIDGTLEHNVQTGLSCAGYFGASNAILEIGGTCTDPGPGVDLLCDDLYGEMSTTASDGPHITQYPLLKTNGSYEASGDGDVTDWDDADADGVHYEEWIAYGTPANEPDDDSSYVETTTKDEKELVTQSTGNPVPVGKTVHSVECFCYGRVTGDSKFGAAFLLRDASDNEWNGVAMVAIGPFTTTYAWKHEFAALAPDGGAWTQGDLATSLQFGLMSHDTDDVGPCCSYMLSPEATWEDGSCDLVPSGRRVLIM